MNIISHLRQSIFSFTNNIPEISAQNKKIALIAAAIFAFIGMCYALLRYWEQQQKPLKVLSDNPSPLLKHETLKEDDETNELMEALNKKIDKTHKFCVDKFKDADDELDKICARFDQEINSLQKEYVEEKRRSSATEQALTDLQLRMDHLEGKDAVQVKKDVSFAQTFSDEYCVLEPTIHGQFPNGIRLDDQASDSLQQLVSKYPNLRFYFTWNIGRPDPDRVKFGEAVKKGPDDAMWCIVSVTRTVSMVPIYRFSSDGVNGVAVFKWNVALKPMSHVLDNVVSLTDNKYNHAPYYEGLLVDLHDDNNKKLAMDTVQKYKNG